jgi:hypothetical protein
MAEVVTPALPGPEVSGENPQFETPRKEEGSKAGSSDDSRKNEVAPETIPEHAGDEPKTPNSSSTGFDEKKFEEVLLRAEQAEKKQKELEAMLDSAKKEADEELEKKEKEKEEMMKKKEEELSGKAAIALKEAEEKQKQLKEELGKMEEELGKKAEEDAAALKEELAVAKQRAEDVSSTDAVVL